MSDDRRTESSPAGRGDPGADAEERRAEHPEEGEAAEPGRKVVQAEAQALHDHGPTHADERGQRTQEHAAKEELLQERSGDQRDDDEDDRRGERAVRLRVVQQLRSAAHAAVVDQGRRDRPHHQRGEDEHEWATPQVTRLEVPAEVFAQTPRPIAPTCNDAGGGNDPVEECVERRVDERPRMHDVRDGNQRESEDVSRQDSADNPQTSDGGNVGGGAFGGRARHPRPTSGVA